MSDIEADRQAPGGVYVNDIPELTLYQRMIPTFGIPKYINDVQLSTVPAGGAVSYVMFPIRLDGMGHGGIFPGQKT